MEGKVHPVCTVTQLVLANIPQHINLHWRGQAGQLLGLHHYNPLLLIHEDKCPWSDQPSCSLYACARCCLVSQPEGNLLHGSQQQPPSPRCALHPSVHPPPSTELLCQELPAHPSSPAGWSWPGGAPLLWRLLLLPHKVSMTGFS